MHSCSIRTRDHALVGWFAQPQMLGKGVKRCAQSVDPKMNTVPSKIVLAVRLGTHAALVISAAPCGFLRASRAHRPACDRYTSVRHSISAQPLPTLGGSEQQSAGRQEPRTSGCLCFAPGCRSTAARPFIPNVLRMASARGCAAQPQVGFTACQPGRLPQVLGSACWPRAGGPSAGQLRAAAGGPPAEAVAGRQPVPGRQVDDE